MPTVLRSTLVFMPHMTYDSGDMTSGKVYWKVHSEGGQAPCGGQTPLCISKTQAAFVAVALAGHIPRLVLALIHPSELPTPGVQVTPGCPQQTPTCSATSFLDCHVLFHIRV